MVLTDVLAHVLGEITEIDYMDLFERIEKVTGEGVAKTVFQDEHSAPVADRGAHAGDAGVAAHEGAVGPAAAVFVLVEEDALVGLALAGDLVVGVDDVVGIGGGVVGAHGDVVDEVLGGVLDGYVLGIAVHAADKAVDDTALVGGEGFERYTGNTGELLGGIEGAKGGPVVVGAQEDVFGGMVAQGGIDIDGTDVGIEVAVDVADGGLLGIGAAAGLLGTVVVGGGGDDHAVDVDGGAEGALVGIGGLGILHAATGAAAIGHEGPDGGTAADDDDAVVGNLGVLVGRQVVVVLADVALVHLMVVGGVFALFDGSVGGMEGDVVVAQDDAQQVFLFHAEGHEPVAVGLGVAIPGVDAGGEGSAEEAVERELGETGKVAFLEG